MPDPILHLKADPARPAISELGWDTEGDARARRNLLRAPARLEVWSENEWRDAASFPFTVERTSESSTVYHLDPASGTKLSWAIDSAPEETILSWIGASGTKLRLAFPFNPRVTPTTVFPRVWQEDGAVQLPTLIQAPDHGPVLLSDSDRAVSSALLAGSRKETTVDLSLDLVIPAHGRCSLRLAPVVLPPPAGFTDAGKWAQVRRNWLTPLQPSSRWGDQGNPRSAPAGILANNIISDPASCSVWLYADQAFWSPVLPEGLSVMPLVRRTVEYWIDRKTRPSGEVICYWDYGNFLDANVGPLIASWDYVESTGDLAWLRTRIDKLEKIAGFLAGRDIDGDGMVEAVQSGNRGTLRQPGRSCCWFDAINCGHKDGYSNAVIYRAWRCLADLEAKLGREVPKQRFTTLAIRLKAAYAKNLFNPATGWLGNWRSADGELHDYASTYVNGLAIEYGLVEPAQGRDILARLRKKMEQAGFTRFDLGAPLHLVPVPPDDYLQPDGYGMPTKSDGTDTFGYYMNGAVFAGHTTEFLAAHYVVGETVIADRILQAMLERQTVEGTFQNGIQDKYPQALDFMTWDGRPAGYEGCLCENFRFVSLILLREERYRKIFYRPLRA
jgi:hypothetical protein